MLASPFILDQRLSDLRPSDDDERVARWLRDASPASVPPRPSASSGRRWLGGLRGGQPARASAR